jgi:hypothetical protein
MKRFSTAFKVAVCAVLIVALAVFLAPAIAQLMATRAADAGASMPAETGETGMDIPFLAQLASASYYGLYGTKTVTGQEGSYRLEYACTVQGQDFVIKTTNNRHEYRQMYVNGRFKLVDDTDQTVQDDICKFDYLDNNLTSAISGKIIRTSGDIIDGNQVTRVEIYKDGIVFAYYLNQQGVLIRFYYIYDGNEVTLNLDRLMVGGSCCASFDIPSTYSKL